MFKQLSRKEKERFLLPVIIRLMQNLGGKTTRKELLEEIRKNIKEIPEEVLDETRLSTKRNGTFKPFDIFFNISLKTLELALFVCFPDRGLIELTEKGRNVDLNYFDLDQDVFAISKPKWKAARRKLTESDSGYQYKLDFNKMLEIDITPLHFIKPVTDWKENLRQALLNMSPQRFEMFCRVLIKQIGVDVDEKIGQSYSHDGGLDGFGYLKDKDTLRTIKVAIQAKRWKNTVQSPEIDKFRGAMNKFNAEFGIFITTSNFSRGAIETSRQGSNVITLINMDDIIELVEKHQIYIKRTYTLDDFYYN